MCVVSYFIQLDFVLMADAYRQHFALHFAEAEIKKYHQFTS